MARGNKMLNSWDSLREAVEKRKMHIATREDVLKVSKLTYLSIAKIEGGDDANYPSVKTCLRYIDAVNSLILEGDAAE